MAARRTDYAPWAPAPPPTLPPLDTTSAERALWDLDGPDGADRQWRRPILQAVPDTIGEDLAKAYRAEWFRAGRRAANSLLRAAWSRLTEYRPSTLLSTYTDEDIRGFARRRAEYNARSIGHHAGDPHRLYEALCVDARRIGVTPPRIGVRGVTLVGALQRLADSRWWRRQLRTSAVQQLETIQREGGRVHKHAQPYVSDHAIKRRRGQRAWTRRLLESLEAVNEMGEAFSLAHLQDHSVANPRNRRHELMTRLAGFQQVADEYGHIGEFITITCPGRFHCRYARDGAPVERFDGSTPQDAQRYLQRVWSQIRAALQRRNIHVYGFRIAEPNHDGTPHWHLILFLDPADQEQLRAVIHDYALREDGDEPGAIDRRVRFVMIDRKRGSAVSYAAKYVAKNIDGFGLDSAPEGLTPAEAAERIASWASTWGIRQFQQIGGPSVTVWRELRKLREPIVQSADLESCRAAADSGDWAAYCTVQGGPLQPSGGQTVRLARAWTDEPTRYGESKGNVLVGITDGCVTIQSQLHDWTIQFVARPSDHGPLGLRTRRPALLREARPAPANTSVHGSITIRTIDRPHHFKARGLLMPLEFCQ